MTATGDGATFLVVDDDDIFCSVLARALERRGFDVAAARTVTEAQQLIARRRPELAVIDLRIGNDSGLTLVRQLSELTPPARSVVLTGYGSIATAVEAIKLGAVHYLTKPADAEEVIQAFARQAGDVHAPVPGAPLSVGRLEWEHIQRVLSDCAGNISEAARKLGMHRRTLQRKLHKRPVRS